MTRFKFKNLRKISWKILSRHKSLYFFCINYLHTTQFFDLCAQSTQEIKWLHGKNTTLISLTIQIFQVRASFNRWFSGSISGRISENFRFGVLSTLITWPSILCYIFILHFIGMYIFFIWFSVFLSGFYKPPALAALDQH